MSEAEHFGSYRRSSAALALVLALAAGCTALTPAGREPPLEPGVFAPTRDGPEGAPPGTCWGRTFTPAVIETVREQVVETPAKVNPDGSLASLPTYRTVERQRIVKSRQDTWFETLCDDRMTEEFVSSLQRALQARGYYVGLISGLLDERTRAAIQRFQVDTGGPESGVLALATARQLGLITAEVAPAAE